MSWLRWFTQNVADTRGPTHPDLGPVRLAGTVAETNVAVRAAVATLTRWAVQPDSTETELRLTRSTGLIGFVDDVTVELVPTDREVLVHARSQSRVGKGDLGQNRRNILELWRALPAKKG